MLIITIFTKLHFVPTYKTGSRKLSFVLIKGTTFPKNEKLLIYPDWTVTFDYTRKP